MKEQFLKALLNSKKILNLEEATVYLGVKKSYMYALTSEKRIKHYKPGGKLIFFKKSELDEWATSNPVPTESELQKEVDSYLLTSKRA